MTRNCNVLVALVILGALNILSLPILPSNDINLVKRADRKKKQSNLSHGPSCECLDCVTQYTRKGPVFRTAIPRVVDALLENVIVRSALYPTAKLADTIVDMIDQKGRLDEYTWDLQHPIPVREERISGESSSLAMQPSRVWHGGTNIPITPYDMNNGDESSQEVYLPSESEVEVPRPSMRRRRGSPHRHG